MAKMYTQRTAALKTTTLDSNIIDGQRLLIYPGKGNRNERINVAEKLSETDSTINELETAVAKLGEKNYAYTDAENTFSDANTFTQYATFNEGLITHGDIVLNGSKLLLANDAAIEVYPDENLPTPVGGYQKLQYYALYKEMTETLLHNAIYHLGEMESIDFVLEEELDDLFSCEVVFTSGATPTIFSGDSRIKWVGDDVNAGVFTPVANVRYSCSLQYDGVFVRGMAFGIPTV